LEPEPLLAIRSFFLNCLEPDPGVKFVRSSNDNSKYVAKKPDPCGQSAARHPALARRMLLPAEAKPLLAFKPDGPSLHCATGPLDPGIPAILDHF
jgi:hypothetical protein